jgi:hypothetical protein
MSVPMSKPSLGNFNEISLPSLPAVVCITSPGTYVEYVMVTGERHLIRTTPRQKRHAR